MDKTAEISKEPRKRLEQILGNEVKSDTLPDNNPLIVYETSYEGLTVNEFLKKKLPFHTYCDIRMKFKSKCGLDYNANLVKNDDGRLRINILGQDPLSYDFVRVEFAISKIVHGIIKINSEYGQNGLSAIMLGNSNSYNTLWYYGREFDKVLQNLKLDVDLKTAGLNNLKEIQLPKEKIVTYNEKHSMN